MLFREAIGVYFKKNTKHIHAASEMYCYVLLQQILCMLPPKFKTLKNRYLDKTVRSYVSSPAHPKLLKL